MSDAITQYASTIVVVLACLGAIGAAMAWIYRKVIVPVREAVDAIREVVELQLTPNHGSSLVDKVARIAPNHAEAQRHWQAIEHRLAKLEAATSDLKDMP